MKRSVFLILLVTAQVCSQQVSFKGTLLDSKTKKPVVYANISFLETTKGISSTENGSFQMYINQKYMKGKVHVSCLNYKDTIVNALELNNTVLLLQPKQHELDEVVLTKRVNRSFLQDKVKKKVHGVHSVGMRMIAKYFPNDKKNRYCNYLSKVTIYFSKRHNKKSKFRVRVFNRDDKTGLPKEDLLNVNLPIAIKEKQLEVIVDLSLYDIECQRMGCLLLSRNCLYHLMNMERNKQHQKTMCFMHLLLDLHNTDIKNQKRERIIISKDSGVSQLSIK